MTKRKLHVADAANKLLDKLNEDGNFNGIDILDIIKECVWHEQYAIFVLQFDIYYESGDNDYITFDFDKFEEDFRQLLKDTFPKCKINYYSGCTEYEIIGPNYEAFAKRYADALEEVEYLTDKWTIFRPPAVAKKTVKKKKLN